MNGESGMVPIGEAIESLLGQVQLLKERGLSDAEIDKAFRNAAKRKA
jgi:hypothetical protein